MTTPGEKKEGFNEVQELALEVDKFRQIVENASDAVVSINQNHEVVFMNRAAEKMFGYRRSEILGGDLSPLIPRKHRENHRHYVERFVRTRRPRLMGHVAEVEAERRDGSLFPMSISFSLAESENDLLLTAVMRDLSAEKNLARKVKEAEHLAAVGQTVATVSHEIRTPLALIGGFARQIRKQEKLSPRAERKLKIIEEEVARLEELLRELNDLSRPLRYKWEDLEPQALARHIQELMEPKLKNRRMEMTLCLDPDLPRVAADRNRLCQVLINLINNAMQASRPGDRIELEIKRNGEEEVVLEVRDQGCGIKPEHQKEMFTPFFTTKQRGTGLGLPVARRIVEDHGGRIEVLSQPGRGTAMRVFLPVTPASRT